jgi:hypothetical protein
MTVDGPGVLPLGGEAVNAGRGTRSADRPSAAWRNQREEGPLERDEIERELLPVVFSGLRRVAEVPSVRPAVPTLNTSNRSVKFGRPCRAARVAELELVQRREGPPALSAIRQAPLSR